MILKNYLRDPIKYVFLALEQRNYLDGLSDKMYLQMHYFASFKKG